MLQEPTGVLCSWINRSFIYSVGFCYCFGSLDDPRLDNKQNTHLRYRYLQAVSSLMPRRSRQWIPGSFSPAVSSKDFSTVRSPAWCCGLWLFASSACCYLSSCLVTVIAAAVLLLQLIYLSSKGLGCQVHLSDHWASAFLCWGGLASFPSTGLKQQWLTPALSCVSLTELTSHPSCQPFQQCLFHPGGHVPEVLPTHRRKCPSPTFFKSWGSHPFPSSQVMAPVSGANCGSSADKIWFVRTKSLTSRKHLHTALCVLTT